MSNRGLESIKSELDASIKVVPDFPIPGILFRDIMPIVADPVLLQKTCSAIAEHCRELPTKVEVVTGLEARGFLFGPQVAIELGVPFVPIRKKGKLPGEVVQTSYIKEYGEDIVEVQKGAVKSGANVFILDDLLATGGTMCAAIHLIEKAGGKVAEAFCLIELADLNGRNKLPQHIPMFSLIKY